MNKLQDKKAIMNILGCLMISPELLSNAKGYYLTANDFPEKFHKIVFGSIKNLYSDGLEKLTANDIYTYLINFPKQLAVFENADGLDYIDKCADITSIENFDYYFQRVRKYTFLRECKMVGIDISDIYNETAIELQDIEEANQRFDEMTLDNMLKHIELKLVEIQDKFRTTSDSVSEKMSDGIDELLENKLKAPSYGVNLGSQYSNTITRGAKTSTFYLRSAPTGGGKTRYNLADLLEITVPERYEESEGKWVKTGANGAGLFITTEIPKDDLRISCLCYIAQVDEDDLEDNNLTFNQIERLNKAKEILEQSNLRIEQLDDFDLDLIELTIEKNILKYDIRYIAFDYIHTSLTLIESIGKKASGLREDLILLMLSDKIKKIANKYDVMILSSTQMNDNWKQEGNKNLDQSSIRGSKAIADKVDVGMILKPLDKADRAFYEEIKPQLQGFNIPEPTHTINYYKNRETKWNFIRVWVNINMGTLRTIDCFVTNYDGDLIPHIKAIKIKHKEEPKKEIIKEDNDNNGEVDTNNLY